MGSITFLVASAMGGGGIDAEAGGAGRLTLCHATGAGKWVSITVAGPAALNGHAHHTGDIVPAFTVASGNRTIVFAGSNLGALPGSTVTGQAVLAAGCSVPPGGGAQLLPATTVPTQTQASTTIRPSSTVPVPTIRPAASTVPAPSLRPPAATAVPGGVPTTRPPATTAAPVAVPTTRPPATVAPGGVPTTRATGATLAPVAVPSTRAPATTAAPVAVPSTRVTGTTAVPPVRPSATASTTTAVPNITVVCAAGEFAYAGNCFALPELVLPSTANVLDLGDVATVPVPLVECVDRAEGRAWFGYQLDGEQSVSVPLGSSNRLADASAQPPTLFGPGRHAFVFYMAADAATWSLAGTTVAVDPSTPECGTDEVLTASTGVAGGDATTTTLLPVVSTGSCGQAQALVDGACVEVLPPILVAVDNVLDCSGHGVARFAAFNPNEFRLPADSISIGLSPERSGVDQAEYVAAELVTGNGSDEVGAVVAVRYVNAVTWTVDVGGASASISAGTEAAVAPATCTGAVAIGGGVNGTSGSRIPNGGADTLSLALVAAGFAAIGVLLVALARRKVVC